MWRARYYLRRYDNPATLAILVVMALVFVADFFTGDALVPALAWSPSVRWLTSHAYWQPLTFPFVHFSGQMLQLLFDAIALYFFGSSLERAWGCAKYLFFFFSCGIIAGLVLIPQTAAGGGEPYFAGMVGSFVAIAVAFAAINPSATILFWFIPMQARWLAAIVVAFELFAGYGRYGGRLEAVIAISVVSLYAYLFATRRVALPTFRGRGPSLRERFERWRQRQRMRAWQRRVSKIDRPEDLFKDK